MLLVVLKIEKVWCVSVINGWCYFVSYDNVIIMFDEDV